jgi:hypothetical protein
MKRRLSGGGVRRRDLVRVLGSAAFALPGLELFGRELRAQAAAKVAKYAVFCYTPDGVNQSAFWPTGTEADFQLGTILAPFEAFKDKLLVLGPEMNGGTPRNGSGLAYAAATPQHQAPVCLTGRIGDIPYGDQSTAVNRLDGPSIDQVIAKAVGAESLFSSLNFGLHPIGGDTPSDINFADDGSALKRMATPDEAYGRVFGMPVDPAMGDMSALHRHTAIGKFSIVTSLRCAATRIASPSALPPAALVSNR